MSTRFEGQWVVATCSRARFDFDADDRVFEAGDDPFCDDQAGHIPKLRVPAGPVVAGIGNG